MMSIQRKSQCISDMEDHGLVDMREFGFLVTRTAALETQIATMNESLSKVTTLLNDLARGQALGH